MPHIKARTKSRDTPQQKRTAGGIAFLLTDVAHDMLCVPGYTSLDRCPEIMTAAWKIAQIIGSITIHLMQNTEDGDIRITNELSRRIDIEPNAYMNRAELMQFVVMTMLVYGDGNAIVLPRTSDGYLGSLEPIPAGNVTYTANPVGYGYTVSVNGKVFDPSEVLHFRYLPDKYYPWKGMGLRVSLRDIANGLKQGRATTNAFMSSEYKPSIIVKVDAMTEEFASPEGRQKLLDSYVKSGKAGEPWMIPAEQFDVEQVKPLTLSDLAIDATMQLSKKTVASIMGVPAFLLGVGTYSKAEWNNFVQSTIRPIVISMQQELTRKLIISPGWYLRFNWWSLMDWSAQEISSVLLAGADRGFINGNEWRDRLGLEPVEGLGEYKVLENYIPIDKSGDQLKLVQDGGADGA